MDYLSVLWILFEINDMFLFLVYLFVFATFCFKFTNFLEIKSKGSCLSCSRYFSGPRSILIWSYNIAILIHCEPLRYSMLLICSSIKYHCFKHQRIKFSLLTLNIFFSWKLMKCTIWFSYWREFDSRHKRSLLCEMFDVFYSHDCCFFQ